MTVDAAGTEANPVPIASLSPEAESETVSAEAPSAEEAVPIESLAPEVAAALCDALLALAKREEQTLLPGYTHLRQAMPSTIGLWAAGA